MKKQELSSFKLSCALFAIALSPFILNAELREISYEDEFDEVAYEDEREPEEDFYEDDGDLADASYSQDRDDHNAHQDPEEAECRSPYHVMHVGARHTEARGVGYQDGYTTIEGFGIYNRNMYFMPFLDLRGHVFNNGKLAGNVGVGERSVIPSINHIFGLYLYYDVRQENHHLTVNQLSPGIELLGSRMEYRINGYFHVGNAHSHKYRYKFSRFHDHNIILKSRQKRAMMGGDAEVGVHITQSTKYDLYFGAGPYYFTTEHAKSWGGKARLLGRYKEYFSLEASYSYDHLFRNVVQGTVGINYPFGRKLRRKGQHCPQQNDLTLSRAAFAPYRFEIPVVKRVHRRTKAINPATGEPWVVWFVNNTSSSSGTFESPFPTLVQAQAASSPNDMIYVFPGDGTTRGMDAGIFLQDGQQLFGSGIAHKIKTRQARITIPAFSSTNPTLTNGGGDVVTLGNGNNVSGLNILVTSGPNGIVGSQIVGATITDNSLFGTVAYNGINITSLNGNFLIKNNQVTGPNIAGTGISVTSLAVNRPTITISDNTVTGFGFGILSGEILSLLSLTPSPVEARVVNNLVQNFSLLGIQFRNTTTSDSIAIVSGNTVINNAGGNGSFGISVLSSFSPKTAVALISNNSITTTTASASTLGISLTGSFNVRANITNNTIVTGGGAGSVGIFAQATTNNTICTSITNNLVTLQAAGTNGISLSTTGTGIINVDNFSDDQAPAISITGNVNLVEPGTCSQ